MKKKWLIALAVLLTIAFGGILLLTQMFTKNILTGKLYRVDNVYEQLWNMVVDEKYGTKTVLITATDNAFVDYDLGEFVSLHIPAYDVYLTFTQEGKLEIAFSSDENGQKLAYGEYIRYVYDEETNTLCGNREEAHLRGRFLSDYLAWVGDTEKYNTENQGGDYAYAYAEYP